MTDRPAVVFAPEAFNLAEVTRMLSIAKAARDRVDPVFLSYDGAARHHGLVEAAGFRLARLSPQMDEARVRHFWAVDRGEKIDDIFTPAELEERVRSELALYDEVRPSAVVTGFCLSTALSARIARVPLVWVSQTTWLPEYARRYATWPDALDAPVLRIAPDALKDRLIRSTMGLLARRLARPFDVVARRHGLPAFRGFALLESDHMLFAEPEGFSGMPVPERLAGRHAFIGPLYGGLDAPIPPALAERRSDRPLVYFAMGSSGHERVVLDVLRAFADQPFDVVAPVAALLKDRDAAAPRNVIVTGWLPAERVNPLARVSVIHGGIGTVMTACRAKTPIVGIPNGLVEQEYNLDCVVRRGFGVRLRLRRFTPRDVVDHVLAYLDDDRARRAASDCGDLLARWDGPANAADYLAALA